MEPNISSLIYHTSLPRNGLRHFFLYRPLYVGGSGGPASGSGLLNAGATNSRVTGVIVERPATKDNKHRPNDGGVSLAGPRLGGDEEESEEGKSKGLAIRRAEEDDDDDDCFVVEETFVGGAGAGLMNRTSMLSDGEVPADEKHGRISGRPLICCLLFTDGC
ncbi:unnamed protein product [Protopolystoma xenopodis]|uniref:Uncharacterized protein n=1 Tax=Protopolystoma xenopodis TaxID=117903 RepID=A0A3S5FED5_9PLAT|nr:unnamed protein product [Protopolystoma xenopodis]